MKHVSAILLCGVALFAIGCNVGNAPEPMAAADVQKEVDKLPAQNQIDWINRSPMPPEEKAKRIAEIKAKHGISDGPTGAAPPGAPSLPR